jgi:DNA-binding CsgD family transcriptional regulator/tetratricopeptide (TPR) repeat protein
MRPARGRRTLERVTAARAAPWHTAAVARRVTCPSFVGRDAELQRLLDAADASRRGGQVVLVGGDAGVGKSRLVDELCARRRAAGHAAAVGGCVDLGDIGVGYAPLAEALRILRTEVTGDIIEALLDDVAPALRPLLTGSEGGDAIAQGTMLAATLALLEELGTVSPGLVIVFEDLHWADASTLALVAFLARKLGAAAITLVLTYRTDDLHRRHPFRPVLAELTRSPSVEHVELTGMSRSELTVLLTGVAGIVPSDATVDEMLDRSEGNPFYAEELLAARGDLDPLPRTVREAILVRVARLPEASQALLREAALLGGIVDDRLLVAATGRPSDEVTAAIRDALAEQILVADTRGCRFRHALVREALHDELLPGERQRLHEAAAAAIAERPELAGGAEHLRWALLAHHWAAAQDQPHAFGASVRAGITAGDVGAQADAASHLQRAVDLWPRVPDPVTAAGMTLTELLLLSADAVSHAGAPARAVGMVESALDQLGDATPETTALVLERLGHHRWVACDEGGSWDAREQAVSLLAGRASSEAQALALAALGRHLSLLDRFVDAEATLRRALEVAAATGSTVAENSALSGLGITLAKLGRVDEGVTVAWRSLRSAQQGGGVEDVSLAYVNLVATLVTAGRCDEAVTVATSGLAHARHTGMVATDGVLMAYGGAEALCSLGRWAEATAMLDATRTSGDGPHGTTGAVLDARIALWHGLFDEAARHRDRALTVREGRSSPAPEALVLAAQLAGREGRFEDAIGHARDALALVEGSEDLTLIASTIAAVMEIEADRVDATRLGGPRGAGPARPSADDLLGRARDAATELGRRGVMPTDEAAAHLAVIEAEHARSAGHPAPDDWSAVADRWDALGFPHPAAVARFREADALLRGRGGRERAADAARRALATAERLGAGPLAEQLHLLAQRGRLDLTARPEPTPARTDPIAELGISPREAEVLTLLGLGRTNRQIAGELYISEKTASVHVTHILRKLNVTSRVEAAAVAQRLDVGT